MKNPSLIIGFVSDKITLIKHLVTAPGTKYAVKLMFKASVIVGGVGLAYKVWNDSHIAEQREAGLFLSDVEAKKLVGSQREKY